MGRSQYARLLSLTKSEKWVLIGECFGLRLPHLTNPLSIAAGIACLVVSSAITMSVPMFLGITIDVVFKKGDGLDQAALNKLGEYSMLLFGIFVLGGLANFARVYLFGNACEYGSISPSAFLLEATLPTLLVRFYLCDKIVMLNTRWIHQEVIECAYAPLKWIILSPLMGN